MVTAQVAFDAEFTSLLDPHLLSIGLVAVQTGEECYVELDLNSDLGRERLALTPPEVREMVLDEFGLFPDSSCDSEWTMGRRVGQWLLSLAERSGGHVELLYDYKADIELLIGALKECNLWPEVRLVCGECYIGNETGTVAAEIAAEVCFKELRHRQPPLYRHHALADALALRDAWRTYQLTRTPDFVRLLNAAGGGLPGGRPVQSLQAAREWETWLLEWLPSPAVALGGRRPLDVIEEPGGVDLVENALGRIAHGTG
jgi:hypothetical protein